MKSFFLNSIAYLLFNACCFFIFSSCRNNVEENNTVAKTSGQIHYETFCTACHGADGKLSALGAKDLSVSKMTKEETEEIISNGKNTMTPFRTLLSPEEISAVADYVQTLKQ